MDRNCCAGGVRFRLFPKPPYVHPDWPPETISVSSLPGSIGPGPSDHRMFLVNPIGKRYAYGVNPGPLGTPRLDLPPWRGRVHQPVCPDAEGHFDYLPEGTPEFEEAHVFGTVRFVLDIWENYFGRPVEWHFARDYRQLEIVILPAVDNAYAGYGFMEVGAHHRADGTLAPFALNFDVMAHELGHLIIYSTIGVPSPAARQGEYYGFQESAADTTALIAALYFKSLQAHLLEETSGNLYTFNELDRFAELSPHDQIRLASNAVKLSEFAAGWEDEHALSQPLTGAVFDITVDIFQEMLVDRGLIPREVAELTRLVRNGPDRAEEVEPFFDAAFRDRVRWLPRRARRRARLHGLRFGRDLEASVSRLLRLRTRRRGDDTGRADHERRPLSSRFRRELRLARDRAGPGRSSLATAGRAQPHPLRSHTHSGNSKSPAKDELSRARADARTFATDYAMNNIGGARCLRHS